MKKTMFDILEKTPEGVDENTIKPAYEIDPEKVQAGVHKKLEAAAGNKTVNTKSKKKSRKVGFILAAAVIAAIAAGTVTVGALGGINTFIGEHSAGEMVNNLYPGGDINLSTNDAIKGDFLGITGDDTNMVSLLQLKNADGSDILDEGKTGFIESADKQDYFDKTSKLVEEDVLDIDPRGTEPLDVSNIPTRKAMIWNTAGYDISEYTGEDDPVSDISHTVWFKKPFEYTYPAFIDYEFADTKTINCYISSHIDSGLLQSLKGETLRFSDKNLCIYQIDKVLYETDSEEEFIYFNMDYDKFNGLISDNIKSLRDDQVIILHNLSMVIATKKIIDIDTQLSVKLNYKSNTKQLTPPSETFKSSSGTDYTINKVTAGPLSTELELGITIPEGADEYKTFIKTALDFSKPSKITLTNGKVIYAHYNVNHNYFEHYTVTLTYSDSENENNSQWVIVNPDEIKTIELPSATITA